MLKIYSQSLFLNREVNAFYRTEFNSTESRIPHGKGIFRHLKNQYRKNKNKLAAEKQNNKKTAKNHFETADAESMIAAAAQLSLTLSPFACKYISMTGILKNSRSHKEKPPFCSLVSI